MDLEKNLKTNVVDLESKKAAKNSKESRLKRLQEQIDKGMYKIPSEEIAERMVKKESDILSVNPVLPSRLKSEKNSKKK